MTVAVNSYAQAVAAYSRALAGATATPSLESPGGMSFGEMVGNAMNSAMDTAKGSEKVSLEAISGQADLNQVITAVTEAEVTLQSVVAIRDRVVDAYREILRMSM